MEPIHHKIAVKINDRMNRKPKLMHVIHDDGPGGGPVAIVEELKWFKDKTDQRVVHGGSGKIAAYCDEQGIAHHQIPFERKWKIPFGVFALAILFCRYKPDVILLHGQWAAPLGVVVARLLRVPKIVYLAHWPAFYTDWDLVRTLRNYLVESAPCRLAHEVVTITESSCYQYLYRGWVEEAHLHVVPYAFDPSLLPADEDISSFRREHGMDDQHIHVVCTARIETQKRIDWLLRAWPLIVESVPAARLWIAGKGSLLPQMKTLAHTLGIQTSCTFLGELPTGMLAMAAGDVVVSTSMYESFGYVALEAMACGKPMVAMEADGIRNLITTGQNGLLTPPGNLHAFADALSGLLRSKEKQMIMGQAGLATLQQYRADRVMPRLEAIVIPVHGIRT